MYTPPENPILLKIMQATINKELTIKEVAFDYDSCVYQVLKRQDEDFVLFGFSCNCFNDIMQNGGQEMLDELYPEFKAGPGQKIEDFDITLAISLTQLPKTQKLKKTLSEEE